MLTCSRFLKSRSEEGIPGSPRTSQKRGEKDQGTLRAPGGFPLALFRFAWTSRPSFWLSPPPGGARRSPKASCRLLSPLEQLGSHWGTRRLGRHLPSPRGSRPGSSWVLLGLAGSPQAPLASGSVPELLGPGVDSQSL